MLEQPALDSYCFVCGMSFRQRYGEAMKISFMSTTSYLYRLLAPNTRLIRSTTLGPCAPNSHAVIHCGEFPLTIEQARALLMLVLER